MVSGVCDQLEWDMALLSCEMTLGLLFHEKAEYGGK